MFCFFWCRPTVEEVYSRVAVFLSMRGILYSDNGVVCVNFFLIYFVFLRNFLILVLFENNGNIRKYRSKRVKNISTFRFFWLTMQVL